MAMQSLAPCKEYPNIPCNRTVWSLTGWKQACREEAGGPDGQVEQESAVCTYGNEGKPYTSLH